MTEADITYITEDVAGRFAADLTAADTLKKLKTVMKEWAWCASDAEIIVREMTAQDFEAFRVGLDKERKGEFSGEEWATSYAPILMPAKMMLTSMTAMQFHAPWGTAWKQLRRYGKV